MPSPNEQELWSLLFNEKPDFIKAKQLIIDNPKEHLVKSIHERGKSVIMVALDTEIKDPKFIEFVITHPDFDISFEAPQLKRSNLKSLISAGMPHLVEKFKNNPLMFDTNKQLGYELAKRGLSGAEAMFKVASEEQDPDYIKHAETRVQDLKSILAIIRDATIRLAIKNDNVEIFNRLDAAGDNPFDELLDGTLPGLLVNPTNNPKLTNWAKTRLIQSTPKMKNNSSAFYTRENLENQKRNLEHQLNNVNSTILNNGLENMSEIANTFVGSPS